MFPREKFSWDLTYHIVWYHSKPSLTLASTHIEHINYCLNPDLSNAVRMAVCYQAYPEYDTCFHKEKQRVFSQSRSQSFVPLDQRSENESSGSNHYERTKEITEFWLSGSLRICIYGACLKWLLPELSFSDRWSRGTKLWERDWFSLFYDRKLMQSYTTSQDGLTCPDKYCSQSHRA